MEKFNLRSALEKNGATLDENQIKFVSAFETALDERSKSQNEEYSTSITAALRATLGAEEKDKDGNLITIATQIRNIAEAMENMEKKQTRSLSNIEKFQLRKAIEDNKSKITEAIRTGQDFEMEFSAKRVAAKFTGATAQTNDTGVLLPINENYELESGISVIRYPENFLLNVISNRQVAKVPQQIIKNEQATAEGAVALVAEGGTKPLTSDTFIRTLTTRNKYAGRIEWTEEFEMDNDMLYAEILSMFEDKVIREWQKGLLATIVSNGVAYTTSVLNGKFVIPDNGLAVIALQSVINGMNFNADTVIMHPSDIVTTMFTQNTLGESRLLPYMQNGQINGLRVFANNGVTLGTVVVFDSSIYKEIHSGFILRFGTYSDQFIKNEKSAIGEVFSILRVAKNTLPGAMAGSLATIRAALQKI